MRPNGKVICFALLLYHGFGEWYIEKIAKLEVLFVDKSEKSKLVDVLSTIEKEFAVLASIPGFLSFNYRRGEKPELHMSARGFKNIFSPKEISFKRFSWGEESGFKYEVAVNIAGIKVFCLMKENELEEYLGEAQLSGDITPAETA